MVDQNPDYYFDMISRYLMFHTTECFNTDWNDPGERKRSIDHDRYTDMLLSFAQMVRGEKQNPYSYDYELQLFKTIKKCCE